MNDSFTNNSCFIIARFKIFFIFLKNSRADFQTSKEKKNRENNLFNLPWLSFYLIIQDMISEIMKITERKLP